MAKKVKDNGQEFTRYLSLTETKQTILDFCGPDGNTPSFLLQGPTAEGKSSLAKMIADELSETGTQYNFVVQHLPQLTEGDMLGLFHVETMENGTQCTTNIPPRWFLRACHEPTVLLLDEPNRALPSVRAGAFQLFLDRQLGEHKLHPMSVVIAAINDGNEYDVNFMDPAEKSRFVQIPVRATPQEFLAYASGWMHPVLHSFLSENTGYIAQNASTDEVFASKRGWQFLNQAATKLLGASTTPPSPDVLARVKNAARSCVGLSATHALSMFLENYSAGLTAEQVLADGLAKHRKAFDKLTIGQVSQISNDLRDVLVKSAAKERKLKPTEFTHMCEFLNAASIEQHMATHVSVQENAEVRALVESFPNASFFWDRTVESTIRTFANIRENLIRQAEAIFLTELVKANIQIPADFKDRAIEEGIDFDAHNGQAKPPEFEEGKEFAKPPEQRQGV